jgi:hypothetical protein
MILKLRKSDSDADSHKTMTSGKRAKRHIERMNAKLNWEKNTTAYLVEGRAPSSCNESTQKKRNTRATKKQRGR